MYIGIDIGGTFIKYALMETEGEIKEKGKIPVRFTDLSSFLATMKGIYAQYEEHGIEGIAISMPGLVDAERGIVVLCGTFRYLSEVNIAEEISAVCDGIRVTVENDGRAAALAEAWKGAAKYAKSCCVLGFGTGIAGAVIIDRKMIRGSHLISGEVSSFPIPSDHKTIVPHQLCDLYSTRTTSRRAAEALQIPYEEMDGEKLMKMYREGNEIIVDLVDEWFYQIAIHCYQLSLIVDPDVICIGGGISADPLFTEGIRKYVHLIFEMSEQLCEPKVVTCEFRNDSNLIGALYHHHEMFS